MNFLGRGVRSAVPAAKNLFWLPLSLLLCAFPALAQSQQPPIVPEAETGVPAAQGAGASAGAHLPAPQSPASISGIVVDQTEAILAGAHVKLAREDQSPEQEVLAGDDGQFSFANVAPGPFHLTIAAPGFTTQTVSGILNPGENQIVPRIQLAVAGAVTEVKVALSQTEVAEAEIKDEEKQFVLGFIPNFYVSYDPKAPPLNSKQKFELAWKTTINPFSFVVIGVTAGIQQAQNTFNGYGQGAQGYGKRFGASYADFVTGTFLGGAILPSLLKQDPRYFYKGTGSWRSRLAYALANAVICKRDNGHWQTNYSNIFGSLAAGGISNAYYPEDNRGAALTFENTLLGIGASAAANVFQEFVVRKLTPNAPKYAKPHS